MKQPTVHLLIIGHYEDLVVASVYGSRESAWKHLVRYARKGWREGVQRPEHEVDDDAEVVRLYFNAPGGGEWYRLEEKKVRR